MLYVMEKTELVGASEVREANFEDYKKLIPNEIILELAKEYLASRVRHEDPLSSPALVRLYLRTRVATEERENFGMLILDSQNRVITDEILFKGTIDSASVYPREVVKIMLKNNGASCILFHNHPSGLAEPSQADRKITRVLKDALATIDCRVLDHLVIGDCEMVSFAERGWV